MTLDVEQKILFAPPDIDEDDIAAVGRVLRSGWITTGQECLELEGELALALKVPHVVAMSSCTAALETAFASLHLPPGARVGVPVWTFVSTALAAVKAGARPVLIDIDPDSLNIDPGRCTEALADGLDALAVVHFGGVTADRAVLAEAADRGVPVVEDAAHAIGASDHRGPVSGNGTVGACLSFYATKNLTSAEGGALVTHDAEVADFARSYRLHGLSHDSWARYRPGAKASYDLMQPGIKANLPDVLAALARSQLRRFPSMQARRRAIVLAYRDRLADLPLEVVPKKLDEGGADHLMVVLLAEGTDRGQVVAKLASLGVGTSVHFQPLHRFRWFVEHAEVGPGGVAVAERLADRALSLPLHSRLSDADVDRVGDALCAALRSGR